jgi:hypothetical protein
MRSLIAKGVAWLGAICAVGLAGLWAFFMWTNDWGRFGSRGWGLWLMGFTTGTIMVFLIVGFISFWVASVIDPDGFR